jgi:hypothetical protein
VDQLEKIEKERIIGCCNEIIAVIQIVGKVCKGKRGRELRKYYEIGIQAAEFLKNNATGIANEPSDELLGLVKKLRAAGVILTSEVLRVLYEDFPQIKKL